MDRVAFSMSDLVAISDFNKGEAGHIFQTIKKTKKAKLVLRRNEPECVLISPERYEEIMNELEDLRDYKLAVERTISMNENECISYEEVLDSLNINKEDLEKIDDVDIE